MHVFVWTKHICCVSIGTNDSVSCLVDSDLVTVTTHQTPSLWPWVCHSYLVWTDQTLHFMIGSLNRNNPRHTGVLTNVYIGGSKGRTQCTPPKDLILSFQHTNFTKHSSVRSWHPHEAGTPLREILHLPLATYPWIKIPGSKFWVTYWLGLKYCPQYVY